MTDLPHSLNHSVLICASRDIVFRYFTDSDRFAGWWGPGSTIDAKVGGEVKIVYPNAVVARGTVAHIEPDRSIAFTYGYEDSEKPIAVGGSLVTIELTDHADGTLVTLRHDLADETSRDQHVPGWRFQLSQFANVVAKEQHEHANARNDEWFAAWTETDANARMRLLEKCVSDDVRLQDAYASLQGRKTLNEHITMCQMHMSSSKMQRSGDVRQCQGTGLAEWSAMDADGNETGSGTNVVRFAKDGRIRSVVGVSMQSKGAGSNDG